MTASGPTNEPPDDDDLTRALAAFVGHAPDGRGARDEPGTGPLLVASDFDGVLAPLGDDPHASRPTPEAAAALARLATLDPSRVRIAFVSGRRIEDLALLASPPVGALLVGSHGAETGEVLGTLPTGPDDEGRERADGTTARVRLVPVENDEAQRDLLAQVTAGLEEIAAPVEGAWVEHKPSAAVLHTRLSPPALAHTASNVAEDLGERLGAHTMVGKNVVEIAVTSTSKGLALDALRERLGSPAVLYLGDDVTDERAFAVLGHDDVGIKVGEGETLASYRVADPAGAARALTSLADLLGA